MIDVTFGGHFEPGGKNMLQPGSDHFDVTWHVIDVKIYTAVRPVFKCSTWMEPE